MNVAELQNIIAKGESETVEFKTSFNKEVIETLAAYANTKGGTVLVGVANNGDIIGITVNIETIQNWLNEIKTKTEPTILPSIESLEIENNYDFIVDL